MKIANICISHKHSPILNDSKYFHIQVGSTLSKLDLGIHRDNTGNNISEKNPTYSELTGLYWFWKNHAKDYDIIGLNHYRRFFLNDDENKLTDEDVLHYLSTYDVILPSKKYYPVSITQQYEIMHYKHDFDILKMILDEKYPEYDYLKIWDNSNYGYLYNMFFMKYDDFVKAMHFIFSILDEVEKRVDISEYSPQQQRIFGFMSERLLSLYCQTNFKKIKELPIEFENVNHKVLILGSNEFKAYLFKIVYRVQQPLSKITSKFLREVLKSRSK